MHVAVITLPGIVSVLQATKYQTLFSLRVPRMKCISLFLDTYKYVSKRSNFTASFHICVGSLSHPVT